MASTTGKESRLSRSPSSAEDRICGASALAASMKSVAESLANGFLLSRQTRLVASQLPLPVRRIALELFCQCDKDAVGVPRSGSRDACRSPAKRGLPAEFSHVCDH
jgi:hypothetical protein